MIDMGISELHRGEERDALFEEGINETKTQQQRVSPSSEKKSVCNHLNFGSLDINLSSVSDHCPTSAIAFSYLQLSAFAISFLDGLDLADRTTSVSPQWISVVAVLTSLSSCE
jgi:hypothetical protein